MEIRKATMKDFDELLNLKLKLKSQERSFNPHLKPVDKVKHHYKRYLKEDIVEKGRIIFLATEKNKIVGTIGGKLYKPIEIYGNEKRAIINNLYVHPSYRKKGIAKTLYKELVKWFKTKKVVRVTLEIYSKNKVALDLYRKLGYKDFFQMLIKKI